MGGMRKERGERDLIKETASLAFQLFLNLFLTLTKFLPTPLLPSS